MALRCFFISALLTPLLFCFDKKPIIPDVTVYHNPKNKEILCVARNMFPDVLKMTWQKKAGSVWQDADKQNVRTTIQEMKGTMSSLFISEKNGKEELTKYACQVEHEGFQKPQQFQVVSTKDGIENPKPVPGQVTCAPKTSNGYSAVSGTDPVKKSELLTASLSYCLLILKSLTYFGIMSVLIYKRSSQTS